MIKKKSNGAGVLVVEELYFLSRGSARRALGIAAGGQLQELLLQGIVNQQSADQRPADAEQEFDRLDGL